MFLEGRIVPYSYSLCLVVDSLVEGSLGHRSLHGLAHVRDRVLYLCDQLLSKVLYQARKLVVSDVEEVLLDLGHHIDGCLGERKSFLYCCHIVELGGEFLKLLIKVVGLLIHKSLQLLQAFLLIGHLDTDFLQCKIGICSILDIFIGNLDRLNRRSNQLIPRALLRRCCLVGELLSRFFPHKRLRLLLG